MKFFAKPKVDALKVLFVTTEAEPFVAVGGLGAVMHTLPVALRGLECDARIFIPRYLKVDDEKWHLKIIHEGLRVPTENQKGPKELICNVKFYEPRGENREVASVPAYFLENMEYYEQRANVYGYADDVVRWMLLSRGALEFLKVSPWIPEVIVCTDWHIGLLANLHKTFYGDDPKLSRIAIVHSIHSLASQMTGSQPRFIPEEEKDDGFTLLPSFEDPRLLKVNGMKRGIINADIINTVSSTYAKEITTARYGEGLDQLLAKKSEQGRLLGIINGLDYSSWNPEKDEVIKYNFSKDNLTPRVKNKATLQENFELPPRSDDFVVGIVARMIIQKGIDLLEAIAPTLLQDLPIQLVAVGEGDPRIMDILLNLKKRFPDQVGVKFTYDNQLPRMIYAGADVVLIPSRFEPSGLTQMEAMAYGCVPIARKTGGLADTVEDYDPERDTGDGFIFSEIDSLALMIAIVRAYQSFCHKPTWQKLQHRVMQRDFSWEKSAKQYVELFKKAIKVHHSSQE